MGDRDTNRLAGALFHERGAAAEGFEAAPTVAKAWDEVGDLARRAALQRLEEAYRRIAEDARARDGGAVMGAPDDAITSLLLQARAEQLADDPEAAASGDEATFDDHDLHWAGGLIQATLIGWFNRHPFAPAPSQPDAWDDNSKRLAILGDWGSGLYGAPVMAKAIEADPRRYDALVHLGDVYYAGTERAIRDRFLGFWPKRPDAVSRALNANHEMYTGGGAYFNLLLKELGQSSSVFAWRNSLWLIVGLDTAYEDGDLTEGQAGWLADLIEASPGRQVVLMTHHQGFSLYEPANDRLIRRLEPLLSAGRIHYWYWGHEHRCVAFDRHPTWNVWGRCVGHSGFPAFRLDDFSTDGTSAPTNNGDLRWLSVPARNGAPGGHVLDGPNRYVTAKPEKYGPNGYMTIEIQGTTLLERVHDADGAVLSYLERRADGRTIPRLHVPMDEAEIVRRLSEDPNDVEAQLAFAALISGMEEGFEAPPPSWEDLPRAGAPQKVLPKLTIPSWQNHNRKVKFDGATVYAPKSGVAYAPEAFAAVIRKATADGVRVRAVGPGHSFERITATRFRVATRDVLLRLCPGNEDKESGFDRLPVAQGVFDERVLAAGLTRRSEADGVLGSVWDEAKKVKEPGHPDQPSALVRLASGTTIRDANLALSLLDLNGKHGFAFRVLGGYDAQTVSGAISTGTHGSAAAGTPGSLCDSCVSIDLFDNRGVLHRYEPDDDGITDPAKYEAHKAEAYYVLHKSSALFHQVVVALGCAGVVYAMTLRVQAAYGLDQRRARGSWRTVRDRLDPASAAPLWTTARNVEVWVNPYAPDDDAQGCLVTRRSWAKVGDLDVGVRGKCYDLGGERIAGDIVRGTTRHDRLAKATKRVADLLELAINASWYGKDGADGERRYYRASQEIFNIGAPNKQHAWSMEAAVPVAKLGAAVDAVRKLMRERIADGFGAKSGGYLSSPISIRFCRGTPHALSLVHGKPDEVYAIMEIIALLDDYELDGKDTASDQQRVIRGRTAMDDCGKLLIQGFGARIHWGQSVPGPDVMPPSEVTKAYPGLDGVRATLDTLDPEGVFVSDFAIRYGLRSGSIT